MDEPFVNMAEISFEHAVLGSHVFVGEELLFLARPSYKTAHGRMQYAWYIRTERKHQLYYRGAAATVTDFYFLIMQGSVNFFSKNNNILSFKI